MEILKSKKETPIIARFPNNRSLIKQVFGFQIPSTQYPNITTIASEEPIEMIIIIIDLTYAFNYRKTGLDIYILVK